MKTWGRTWWGQKFLQQILDGVDKERSKKGKLYADSGKVIDFKVEGIRLFGKVQGITNPFFGIHKEPVYDVVVQALCLSTGRTIEALSSDPLTVMQVLLGELPKHLEEMVSSQRVGPKLFFHRGAVVFSCNCGDYSSPCKHAIALCHVFAEEIDKNPYLLLTLRGINAEKILSYTEHSLLGKIFASIFQEKPSESRLFETFYAQPKESEEVADLRQFWQGGGVSASVSENSGPPPIPAIAIKRQGDYPAFWDNDLSFIELMEEFYERLRS